mmetsp:Transcript_17092/g.28120  ORF Transcript_17092/g.28120 Transcript_17092/m.28120 type:complete len:144 (-) Transcript_17092:139-570(-)
MVPRVADALRTLLLANARRNFASSVENAGKAEAAAATPPEVSSWKAFMDHPAGPKTIFFWAPAMKWCLVIAGLADLKRPVEKISLPQSLALASTGVIWARYSTQIIPVNYNLLAVNIFVGATGIYQVFRKLTEKPKTVEAATS